MANPFLAILILTIFGPIHFGPVIFGHRVLGQANFGQIHFGPIHFGPVHFGPSCFGPGQFWSNPFLASPFLAKKSVLVVSQSVRPRRVGAPKGGAKHRKSWARRVGGPKGGRPRKVGGQTQKKWGPEGWGAQNFAFFCFSLSHSIFALFVFLWGPVVEFCFCLKRQGLKCARLEFSGCCVKPRRPRSRRGFTQQPEIGPAERAVLGKGAGGRRDHSVMADFGQTDFGQFFDRLWPNRLWPILVFQSVDRLWPTRLWPILVF